MASASVFKKDEACSSVLVVLLLPLPLLPLFVVFVVFVVVVAPTIVLVATLLFGFPRLLVRAGEPRKREGNFAALVVNLGEDNDNDGDDDDDGVANSMPYYYYLQFFLSSFLARSWSDGGT